MYAVVRRNVYDLEKMAGSERALQEFQELHAGQPGYVGNLIIETGEGQFVLVTLWRTEEDANAAIPRLVPHIQRLLEPVMAVPSELIGTGQVVVNDLVV